jgi:hypothetical protein
LNRQSPLCENQKCLCRRVVIFTNWAFGGLDAHLVKVQTLSQPDRPASGGRRWPGRKLHFNVFAAPDKVFPILVGDMGSTFKENRANRRPISFKDSTAFVSMGCFFVNSTQTRDVAKKRG